jgi:hypothetical protein
MCSCVVRGLWVVALTSVLIGIACEAAAQDVPAEEQPIGRFAADVRGAFPKFKQDPNLAAAIGVTAPALPARAFGFVVGAHWYALHTRIVTFGVGGEMILARRSRTLGATTPGGAQGPAVTSRLRSISPQISFNIGSRDGWSYISGGIGSSTFTTERADAPLPPQDSRSKTINYGGGARWFSKKHVALSLDLRFYAINPQVATAARPAVPRMTLIAMNVGAAFK